VTFAVDAPNATQQSTVTLRKNRLYHNSFAVDVDANSGLAALAGHAELGLTLKENAIGPSCRNNLFVSFTRISRTLNGVAQVYLNNSTFTLTLNGNTPWSNAWYDNSLGTNNHLIVDTVEIPTGKRISPSDNPAGC
jgi:hypothetical protein